MARYLRDVVRLPDGPELVIRPLGRGDRGRLRSGAERPREGRRFVRGVHELSDADLDRLTDVDHHDREALAAFDAETYDLVGIARFVRADGDPDEAELAVTVADACQGRGIGCALLERLVTLAREEGIRRFDVVMPSEQRSTQRGGDVPLAELAPLHVQLPVPDTDVRGCVRGWLRAAGNGMLGSTLPEA